MSTSDMFAIVGLLLFIKTAHALEGVTAEPIYLDERKICVDGYFLCSNDTRFLCVPGYKICDKTKDCPDGSDETNCDDTFNSYYFDHMFRKNAAAEHDDQNGTCDLPYNRTECSCRSRDLYCHNLNLSVSPSYLPQANIDILDFTGNNFAVLSADSLLTVPKQVERLILKHCNIWRIEAKTFYRLHNINMIYLDNNELKKFPSNLFQEENTHKHLILSYNDISTIEEDAFINLKSLTELDLRGNKITEIQPKVFEPLKNLTTLYLQQNFIVYVYSTSFPEMDSLETLSLMENKIISVETEAFAKMNSLNSLFLSNNRLTAIRNRPFMNLTRLEALTLNDNLLEDIGVDVFSDVPNLKSLKLENNKFTMLDQRVLFPLRKLPNIYFDRFEMCSSAPHVRNCYPKGDGISSQKHLLDNYILRTCVWVMGAIGCTGNLIVLLGRLLGPSNNVVHSLYLRNLAFSDLLMGIYLFIIAAVDQEYRGEYLMHQYQWRHSLRCNLCGFLSTLSCESSVLILTLVTYDRFISVTQPLARKQPSPRTAALTLLILWICASIVALAPISNIGSSYFGDEFYGSNGVCLSLHIHDPYAKGWEYSAAMFILINALALVFISYAYLRMINEIKASGVACRSTRQSQDRDKVAQRFGIIVLTDSLCWVPIIIVKLVALSGLPIPQDLYAWLAIFVLPINSALNPVLYTLTTTVFKKQVRKIINTRLYKRKRPDHSHSASESGFSLSFGVFPLGGSSRRIMSQRGTQTNIW
ncbi:relaxin receptor 2 [Aethina tumida]|uniref:relaxin receptor 2 n=1 Tax=Aethina tumida TaxID=116153 RepID=UPI002147A179|nr:relaxin receptor 2 [Aethina tumida]